MDRNHVPERCHNRETRAVVGLCKDVHHIAVLSRPIGRFAGLISSNRVQAADYLGAETAVNLNDFFGPRRPFFKLSDQELQAVLLAPDIDQVMEVELRAAAEYLGPQRLRHGLRQFRQACWTLIDSLLETGGLVLNTHLNTPYLAEAARKGVELVGPAPAIAEYYFNKCNGLEAAKRLGLPLAPGFVHEGPLPEAWARISAESEWDRGAFVSAFRGFSGNQAGRVAGPADIGAVCGAPPYIISRWIRKRRSPNSLVLVGPDSCLYLGASDQILLDGLRYAGNLYPSACREQVLDDIRGYSLRLGELMRRDGYRGFAGFDWMVDQGERLYFCEINPRKNRSTSTLLHFLEHPAEAGRRIHSRLEILSTRGEPIATLAPDPRPYGGAWAILLIRAAAGADLNALLKGVAKKARETPGVAYAFHGIPVGNAEIFAGQSGCDIAKLMVWGRSREPIRSLIDRIGRSCYGDRFSPMSASPRS